MADRKVKRNTSKQIISYAVDPEGTDSYGNVKFPASKTVYDKNKFNKVLYVAPTELINPATPAGITFLREPRLDFTEFIDIFSATYLIPTSLAAKGDVYKTIRFPNGIADNSKNKTPGVAQNLQFTKIQSGPPQKTPGRYTITPELIETGKDLRLEWKLKLWNSRNANVQNSSMISRFRFGTDGSVSKEFGLNSILTNGADAKGKASGVDLQLHGEFIIENSEMIAGDEWELQGSSGSDHSQSIYTGRSWWKIEVVDSGTKVNGQLAARNKSERDRIDRVEAARLARIAAIEAARLAQEEYNAAFLARIVAEDLRIKKEKEEAARKAKAAKAAAAAKALADAAAAAEAEKRRKAALLAGLLFFSDERLKENITQIGSSPSGIPIYRFNHIGDAGIYRGVIAQDLLQMGRGDAVSEKDGFFAVDYDMIDVDFELIEDNNIGG